MTTGLTVAPAPLASIPWAEAVDAYVDAILDSPHTRSAYRGNLRNGFAAMGIADMAELTPILLGRWRGQVLAEAVSPSTKALRISAMRSFLRWARSVGASPIPWEIVESTLRAPKATVLNPMVVLSDDEVMAMLGACRVSQHRAILATLVGAGLRLAEVVALDCGDLVAGTPPVLHVRQGKGRKDRLVPVAADLEAILREQIGQRGPAAPMFCGVNGRISRAGVSNLVERAVLRAGIHDKRVSPHSLRHTFAMRALRQSGRDIMAVKHLLGHTQVTVTQRYVDHIQLPELAATVPTLPGVPVTVSGAQAQRAVKAAQRRWQTRGEIGRLRAHNAALQARLGRLNAALDALEPQLAAKDRQIASLNRDVLAEIREVRVWLGEPPL